MEHDKDSVLPSIKRRINQINDSKTRIESKEKEIKRLKESIQVDKNKIDRSNEDIKYMLEAIGEKEIFTGINDVSVGDAGGKRSLKILRNVEDMPRKYQIKEVVTKIDTEKLREDLESCEGNTMNGIAYLEERKQIVRIR